VNSFKFDGKLLPPVLRDTKLRFDVILAFEDVIPANQFVVIEIYVILLKRRL
jgi:hypothetical protein